MNRPMTPNLSFISEGKIDEFRANRTPTTFKGCTQISQLFVKSDGMVSCSCMRYWDILADAREVDVGEFFNGKLMQFIRECFAEGYEPFDFCKDCASRRSSSAPTAPIQKQVSLHIEPSNQCNLFCEACLCTYERFTDNTPPRRSLDYDLYEKILRDIHRADLHLTRLALVGFGEPLFNSRTPDMARLGRELFPSAHIFVDTNGNFGKRRAEELANCGINEVRIALDGIDQASYEPYRRNGEFDRAWQFARDLAQAIRDTNSSTRAIWKYILFNHNDSDEQIQAAVRMAAEIGVTLVFDGTVGDNASQRTSADLIALIGRPFGYSIDPTSTDGKMPQLGELERGTPLWRRVMRLRNRPKHIVT
jgi:pyruvate-formate lyase-activating enzyme